MREAVEYAYQHGVKVYIAINILAHNRDFVDLDAYLLSLHEAKVDTLIVADSGILLRARKIVPEMK
jgi:putative protease